MTCIIGLTDKEAGITYMGGDSLGSNGYTEMVRKDGKDMIL